MSEPNQLPHLLKLLSDESETVQKALLKALLEFGPSLEEELDRLPEPPSPEERDQIKSILDIYAQQKLLEKWPYWQSCETEEEQLESALAMLAEYQSGLFYPLQLTDLLEELAEDYRCTYVEEDRNVFTLSEFLFRIKKLEGSSDNYYDPRHSNLVSVIETKKGIPISLACIYILVGARFGMVIEGCNFPHHFLARVYANNEMFFVDCFHQGLFYREQELLKMVKGTASEFHEVLKMNPNPEVIIARVLNNLIAAYESEGDSRNSQFMAQLLQMISDPPAL